MIRETFNWPTYIGSSMETETRVLRAQFGDGYEQLAGDGINPDTDSWQIEVRRPAAEVRACREFLLRHGQHTPFVWLPPCGLGESGLWRREGSISVSSLGGNILSLRTTFRQFHAPGV